MSEKIMLYGTPLCGMVPPVRGVLDRAGASYEYIDISQDDVARQRVREINEGLESVPTLEFRFPDICTRIDEVICIAALLLALVTKLVQLRRANLCWRDYRRNLITENKWRAVRYGIEGELIDFGRRKEVPLRGLILEMLELIDDVVDELDIRGDIDHVHRILVEGTSDDRQLAVYRETGDLRAVVDHIVEETLAGCPTD